MRSLLLGSVLAAALANGGCKYDEQGTIFNQTPEPPKIQVIVANIGNQVVRLCYHENGIEAPSTGVIVLREPACIQKSGFTPTNQCLSGAGALGVDRDINENPIGLTVKIPAQGKDPERIATIGALYETRETNVGKKYLKSVCIK